MLGTRKGEINVTNIQVRPSEDMSAILFTKFKENLKVWKQKGTTNEQRNTIYSRLLNINKRPGY